MDEDPINIYEEGGIQSYSIYAKLLLLYDVNLWVYITDNTVFTDKYLVYFANAKKFFFFCSSITIKIYIIKFQLLTYE